MKMGTPCGAQSDAIDSENGRFGLKSGSIAVITFPGEI
jgi:hypothetical protein